MGLRRSATSAGFLFRHRAAPGRWFFQPGPFEEPGWRKTQRARYKLGPWFHYCFFGDFVLHSNAISTRGRIVNIRACGIDRPIKLKLGFRTTTNSASRLSIASCGLSAQHSTRPCTTLLPRVLCMSTDISYCYEMVQNRLSILAPRPLVSRSLLGSAVRYHWLGIRTSSSRCTWSAPR